MKLHVHYFYIVFALSLLAACSGGTSDIDTTPAATSGGIVKPNLAQTKSIPINVLTGRYDNARTGANLNEAILNQANVNVDQFGKLFSRTVEGDIYAQPLYVQDLEMPDKQKHNVVYVATMHNMVYAFDADDPEQAAPIWKADLGTPFTQNILADLPGGEDGILGTPVIDLNSQTIYVVSRNWENKAVYKLHALDIRTGTPKFGSPMLVELSMQGTGNPKTNSGGIVRLNAANQLQRPGLLLVNDTIVIAFGSNNDVGEWFGWLGAYSASTLKPTGVFNATPNGYQGGIWMGGAGVSTDGTYLYLTSANGAFNGNEGGTEYGNSLLKLQHKDNQFEVVDYYTPTDWKALFEADNGLGPTGAILMLNANIILAGGKEGNLYLVDKTRMGEFNTTTDTSLQRLNVGAGSMYTNPLFWENPLDNRILIYTWNQFDAIRAYALNTTTRKLIEQPVSESRIKNAGKPIGSMTISANGSQAGSAILWAIYAPRASNGDPGGVVVALDPANLSKIFWNSDRNKERDGLGETSKFGLPTIANGKVYVPTFSDQLVVYGLLGG